MSRVVNATNPETSQTGSGGTTYYYYDADSTCSSSWPAAGNLLRRVDPAGNVTCYGWDGLHRLATLTYPSGPNAANTLSKTYIYDITLPFGSNGPSVSNPLGRLTGAYPGNYQGGEAFGYDAAGNATDFYETTPNSGGWYHVVNAYAPDGAVWGRRGYLGQGTTTPFSNSLGYVVNQEGQLDGLWDQTAQKSVWANSTYNAAGEPMLVSFYNGDKETFSWDQVTGHMNSWDSYVGTSQQTGTLTWNSNGSMQQMQINDSLNAPNTQTCGYVHDDLLRISGVGCQSGWGQNFSYDAYGNITKTVTGSLGTAFTLGYDSGNHVHTYGYDGDGNVTNDASHTYSYDAEGRPVTVVDAGITGSYDAFNRLVEVHTSGATTQVLYAPDGYKFAYMNGQSVKQYMAPLAGSLQAVYTSATPNPPAYWLHSDWLGSARLASTPSQTLYGDQAYAPFGETYYTKNNTLNVFTGQTQDLNSTSNVYDFLYRQYSSTQGRWMVPDPAGAAAVDITNPQTWNRYAYVGNNPLNAVDPQGLVFCAYVGFSNCDGAGDSGAGEGDESGGGGGGGITICVGCGGGGGGGGTGGGGTSGGGNIANFPNGESLGIPNGLPTSPWGITGAIIPNAQCGDITCTPIGNGFTPALAAPICVAAPEVCIIGGIGLTIYAIVKFGPPLIHLIEDASSSSDLTKDKMQVCVYSGEFEDSHVDPQYKICAYSCSDGHARTIPFPRTSACPKTQWLPK